MLVAITGHDIALLVNGVQYGEDVGVLMQVFMPEAGHVELALAVSGIDGVYYLQLMDSQGNEFVGGAITEYESLGGALSNYFRAMGFAIDDVYTETPDMSYPLFRLPSNGSFEPAWFSYSAEQIGHQPAMSRMSEGDEFAVFVDGLYVLNRLERSGSTLVYRTYVLPCNPAVENAGLEFGYVGSYNQGFEIDDTTSCDGQIITGLLSDWWSQPGVVPLPYQFEQVVYYTDSMRLMPLLFVEY